MSELTKTNNYIRSNIRFEDADASPSTSRTRLEFMLSRGYTMYSFQLLIIILKRTSPTRMLGMCSSMCGEDCKNI